jgi:hypothetical protein
MSKTTEFARSRTGLIHLVNPDGGEHTLCGDAFDIDLGDEANGWEVVQASTVTCMECALVIKACRGVRVSAKLISSRSQ